MKRGNPGTPEHAAAIRAGMVRKRHASQQWKLAREGQPHEAVPTVRFHSKALLNRRIALYDCEICHRENLDYKEQHGTT